MLLGKDLTGNEVISVSDGRKIGVVRDIYANGSFTELSGLYLGVKGFLDRTPRFVRREDIVTLGQDVILVNYPGAILEGADSVEENWVRRDDIQGRRIETQGQTPVGLVDDLILDTQGTIKGLSLSIAYVSGPVATKRAVDRHTIIDLNNEGAITVNLSAVEKQELELA